MVGGGGPSTNSQYSLTGTIGQHDSGGPMGGGGYSVTGGFWALINLVQTPGLPDLSIVRNALNSVQVLWPNAATNSYTLEQNSDLSNTGGWVTSGYSISNNGGTNSVTITPPTGKLFFRLKQ